MLPNVYVSSLDGIRLEITCPLTVKLPGVVKLPTLAVPLTCNVVNVPTLVILVCDAVVKVPAMLVALIFAADKLPEIETKLFDLLNVKPANALAFPPSLITTPVSVPCYLQRYR